MKKWIPMIAVLLMFSLMACSGAETPDTSVNSGENKPIVSETENKTRDITMKKRPTGAMSRMKRKRET